MPFVDLTGRRFDRLKVIERKSPPNNRRECYWLCKCDCGNRVVVAAYSLKNGLSRSCGCLQRELIGDRMRTHGMFGTREYRTWFSMKERCYKSNNAGYYKYGGRGIRVCRRWIESFENFYADMGPKPKGLTLERIDSDGDYEPSNCKWATYKEQNLNRRSRK